MDSDAFWITRTNAIEAFLKTLKSGHAEVICKSAGGRPVYSISYGAKPDLKRTANYASAIASGRPDAYFGETGGRTRSIVLVGAVHGMEVENTMGLVNLASVIETGHDLAGIRRRRIADAAKRLRIVIVPLACPDGRERQPREDLVGASAEEQRLYCQGRYADGTLMTHPDCKKLHPMPLDCKWLGGYFNDDGVNIQADCDFSRFLARETEALVRLVVDEAPEAVANMHSHSTGPVMFYTDTPFAAAVDVRRAQVSEVCYRRLLEKGLRPLPPYRYKSSEGHFALDGMFHYLCGSLPIVCECPHGVASLPYTREEILEIQMTFYEVFLTLLDQEGLRPPLPQ
jgi:hypothetical protein